jgi:hypothetical protein
LPSPCPCFELVQRVQNWYTHTLKLGLLPWRQQQWLSQYGLLCPTLPPPKTLS